ncbi:MAG: hypothetical protein HY748_07285 [Elusimicrobia bacterium]|nr:hypothetical protein [Elusimicrobiota bacterium]
MKRSFEPVAPSPDAAGADRPAAVLPRRWRRLGLAAGIGLAAVIVLTRQPVLETLAGVAANFKERRGQRASLGVHIDEAHRLGLDYATIVREPEDHVGQPVVWCVDHPSWGTAYLAGKPSEPLVLENESAFPLNSPTSGGRCAVVVAVVSGVQENGIVLRYAGAP